VELARRQRIVEPAMSSFDSSPSGPPPAEPPFAPGDVILNGTREWERTYSLFVHLSALSHFLIPVPVIVALVLWLIKRDQSSFIDKSGKSALNFQISVWIYGLAGGALALVVGFLTCGLGWLLVIPVGIAFFVACVVFPILAALAANRGELYRYPLVIPFFSI